MNNKTDTFGDSPVREEGLSDEWVQGKTKTARNEPVVRISLDVPESLHLKAKIDCARKKTTLAAMLRKLLVEKYGGSGEADADN